MSINIHDGSSFNEVSKVHVAPNYSTSLKKSQRVWVHNGTKYVMVKGRLLEVVWEVDMSTWGGVAWENGYPKYPYYNAGLAMAVLDDGSLLYLLEEVIANNTNNQTSSNRYALMKVDGTSGSMSKWGSTTWKSWTSVAGYKYTAIPMFMVRCGTNYAFFSEHAIVYLFNSSGTYKSILETEEWHTNGTARSIYESKDYGIKVDVCPNKSAGCIYFELSRENSDSVDSSSYMTSCYRIGYNGTSLYTPREHYSGFRSARYYSIATNLVCDIEGNYVITSFDSQNSSSEGGYPNYLVSLNGNSSYSSSSSGSVVCSLALEYEYSNAREMPIFAKDGYVYTFSIDGGIDPSYVTKRKISDLSIVWRLSFPLTSNADREAGNIHQQCPAYEDGFILPNGVVVHPDGTFDKPTSLIETATGDSYGNNLYDNFCFSESLGIGYTSYFYSDSKYNSDTQTTTYNANGNAVCKIYKFKEVKK